MRKDREYDEIRKIEVELDYTPSPDGSVLIKAGNTRIICSVMIEDKVPFFLKGKNTGWLSCEYSMLPGSTSNRKVRDISKGRIDGRTQEIQRLIGRSLRSCIDLSKIGERTIWIDCDVISADGGTRTLSISGAFIALNLAVKKYLKEGKLLINPIKNKLAAVSIGIVESKKLLDIEYSEDSIAEVDLNIVMNDKMELVEIQGTAEGRSFSRSELDELLNLSEKGIKEIFLVQDQVLKDSDTIILSTNNINKINEIKDILKEIDINIISKEEAGLNYIDVEENMPTLEGNAHLKASALKNKSFHSILADDTGLFVNALDGNPGVHSARYAGEHDDKKNREFLLKNLKDKKDRRAYFKTVIVYIDEDGNEHIFEGICKGEITTEELGEKGFGYDSIFIPKGYKKTFAQMNEEEKNSISHRKIAINKFKEYIEEKYLE